MATSLYQIFYYVTSVHWWFATCILPLVVFCYYKKSPAFWAPTWPYWSPSCPIQSEILHTPCEKVGEEKKPKWYMRRGGAWPRDGLPLFSFVLRHLCRFTVFYLATKRSVKNARCLSSCCQNQPTVIWPASVLMYAIAGIQTFSLKTFSPPGYHCLNFKKTP